MSLTQHCFILTLCASSLTSSDQSWLQQPRCRCTPCPLTCPQQRQTIPQLVFTSVCFPHSTDSVIASVWLFTQLYTLSMVASKTITLACHGRSVWKQYSMRSRKLEQYENYIIKFSIIVHCVSKNVPTFWLCVRQIWTDFNKNWSKGLATFFSMHHFSSSTSKILKCLPPVPSIWCKDDDDEIFNIFTIFLENNC